MINLRLKFRDDEIETLLNCIKLAATYYNSKSVTEITAGNAKGFSDAHEKKTYARQLYSHIKRAVDSANETKELEEETLKDYNMEIEDVNDRLTNALTEFECSDYEEPKVFANEVAIVIEKLTGMLS